MPKPRSDYCPHGHKLVGDNLYVDPRGWRNCRECRRTRPRKANAIPLEPLIGAARVDTQEELAELLGVNRWTVMRWKKYGIPFFSADKAASKIGRHMDDIWDLGIYDDL